MIVSADMGASVWALSVPDGAIVKAGDVIAVLESMKMEIPVEAPISGTVKFIVAEGAEVSAGGTIAEITPPEAP